MKIILLAILLTVLTPFNILVLWALNKTVKETTDITSKSGMKVLMFILTVNYLSILGGVFLW